MTRSLSTWKQEHEEGAPVQEDSLAELMIRYQGGDFCAFKELYATLVEEVRRYFVRIC